MSQSEFAQRQLAFLRSGGLSRDAALARLGEELPAAQIGELAGTPPSALERHLRGFEAELGGRYPHIDSALADLRREVATAFRPIWHSYHGVAVHFALVTAFAWVLFMTIGLYVVPQFETLYGSWGSELPTLTRMAMSAIPRTLLLLLLTGCAIALFWLPGRVQRTVELEQPATGARLPRLFLGRSVDQFWSLLEMTLARAATQSGMSAADALDFAGRCVDGWPAAQAGAGPQRSELRQQMGAAGRLGTLDSELSHQIYAHLSELPIRASAQRELIGFVVNLLLGIVIGVLVVAIYIPIFKLAVVI